jgi:hypothetical protein
MLLEYSAAEFPPYFSDILVQKSLRYAFKGFTIDAKRFNTGVRVSGSFIKRQYTSKEGLRKVGEEVGTGWEGWRRRS